jgi:hypothetical protein
MAQVAVGVLLLNHSAEAVVREVVDSLIPAPDLGKATEVVVEEADLDVVWRAPQRHPA